MKKILLYGVALSLSISLIGCTAPKNQDNSTGKVQNQIEEQTPEDKLDKEEITIDKQDKEEVTRLVEEFGGKLQSVSLLSPKEELEKSMKENYRGLVSEDLMNKWLNNPEDALGRFVSSPWPDRIEIENVEKISDTEYEVEGNIIEITSSENDEPISRTITLTVRKIDIVWLIDDVVLGEYNK
ncbi:hypothetical protein ACF3M2_07465 [Tissierella carlieri]|jgi:hypothetical protein|uniref:hypothetical protein n=1 Tax=Tissierella TaxID=41273 RepID=UPI00280656B2|nr:hypothetical protein [uncultured Tissierella sp.]MDU5082489.1 hypothetical protein [Bacillota bacterium]